MERFWPDLAHYRLACWIEALPDPPTGSTAPSSRQYRFRLMPIGAMSAQDMTAAQEALAPLVRDWGAEIRVLSPEGIAATWIGSKVPSSIAFLERLPAAVIRPLESLTRGPWWRERPATGPSAQWVWRVLDPPISRLGTVPSRYGQVPYELWTETPEAAARYGDRYEAVTRSECLTATPLCAEARNGGLWVLTPDPAHGLVVTEADGVAIPPPVLEGALSLSLSKEAPVRGEGTIAALPAAQSPAMTRQDFGEKIGGARKDLASRGEPLYDAPTEWAERTQLSLPAIREAAKKVRRELYWPAPTAADRAAFFAAGGSPWVWLLREAVRETISASPANLASVKRAVRARYRSDAGKARVLAAAAFYYPRLVGILRAQVESWVSLEDPMRRIAQDQRHAADWHGSRARRLFGHDQLTTSLDGLEIGQWVEREEELAALMAAIPPAEAYATLGAVGSAPPARLWQFVVRAAGVADFLDGLSRRPPSADAGRAAREEAYGVWTRVTGAPASRCLDGSLTPLAWSDYLYGWPELLVRLACLDDLAQREGVSETVKSRVEAADPGKEPVDHAVDEEAAGALASPDGESSDKGPDGMIGQGIPKRLIPSPRFAHLTRSGPARREGSVTEAELATTFGLRAIEYGNWVKEGDRQVMLDLAFDSLADMAEALGVRTEAMGFQGQLALALGARGRGGSAAAHYEPARRVINLTKTMGAGTLAHEWSHALDHWLTYRQEPCSLILATTRRTGGPEGAIPGAGETSLIQALRVFQEQLRLRDPAATAADDLSGRFVTQLLESELLAPAVHLAPLEAGRVVSAWVRDAVIPLMTQAGPSPSAFAALFCERGGRRGAWVYRDDVGVRRCRDWVAEHPEVGRWTPEIEKALSDFLSRPKSPGRPSFPYASFRRVWKRLGALERDRKFTPFYRSALHLDAGRATPHWSSPHELFARGFSAVVHDRMARIGIRNDFASRFSAPGEFTDDQWRASPNPEGPERERLAVAAEPFCAQLGRVLNEPAGAPRTETVPLVQQATTPVAARP